MDGVIGGSGRISMSNGMVRLGTPHVRHGMRGAKFAAHAITCSRESEMATVGTNAWGVAPSGGCGLRP